MGEVRITRKELADLIRDGALPARCPGCAAPLHLKLTDLGAAPAKAEPGKRPATGKELLESPKCVSCSRPITAYAFAVRKGLCPDCYAIMGGPMPKPGRESPPAEPPPT